MTRANPKIIAHRGGVVGDEHAENSPASVAAAIERGYWMIEVDIRESADGKLVVQHDADFTKFYNDPRLLAEMSWPEIAELRAEPGGSRPMQFHELTALVKGRLRLMLDTKPTVQTDAYFEAVAQTLRDYDLLETAYVIETQQPSEWIQAGARVGRPLTDLETAAERGEDIAKGYFLFEHGRDLTSDKVKRGRALNVPVVPSINIYHYADLEDHMEAAQADTHRMLELGVEEFQIDSPYDVWLR